MIYQILTSAIRRKNSYDGSYSVSDTQDYFEHTIKKHETVTNNPPIRKYANKIEKKNLKLKEGIIILSF